MEASAASRTLHYSKKRTRRGIIPGHPDWPRQKRKPSAPGGQKA